MMFWFILSINLSVLCSSGGSVTLSGKRYSGNADYFSGIVELVIVARKEILLPAKARGELLLLKERKGRKVINYQ